uniref:TPR_REGION domain-containing protein n=1 Tax=Gongylonema pulchrum TaxID=637853 RepID=A0A183DIV5_9BILA
LKAEAVGLTVQCYHSLAACIVNGQNRTESDFLRAVDYCDKVLSYEPGNGKVLLLKVSALRKANRLENAVAFLRKYDDNSLKANLKAIGAPLVSCLEK